MSGAFERLRHLHLGLGIRPHLVRARARYAGARMYAERHALAAFGRDDPHPGGRILCYHTFDQPHWTVNDVAPARFRQQLEDSLVAGYEFVPAATIARGDGGPQQLAVTFDDGAKSVLQVAAPILAEYGIPFSAFIVSDWSEGLDGPGLEEVLDWDEVVRLAELGGEIGNHSATHPDFGRLGAGEAADEIGRAAELIERRTGIRPSSFAIPLGQSRNWTPEADRIAREAGYPLVYAQAEATRHPGTIARTFVTAFDDPRVWRGLLRGRFDQWEEWV